MNIKWVIRRSNMVSEFERFLVGHLHLLKNEVRLGKRDRSRGKNANTVAKQAAVSLRQYFLRSRTR